MRIGILTAIQEEIRSFPERKDTGLQLAGNPLFRIPHPFHELLLIAGGMGKVKSAVMSTLLIQEQKVELILFTGIAGSLDPDLMLGEVCLGKCLIQHDYGSIRKNRMQIYPAGAIPLGTVNDPALRPYPWMENMLLSQLPKLRPVTILSGDVFVQCNKTRKRLHDEFQAQLIDMESAAAAQVAAILGIPFLAVRAVSDLAGEHSGALPRENLMMAAKAAAENALAVIEVLSSEKTAKPDQR